MVANAAAVLNLRLVAGCIAWLAIAHSAAAQQPLGGVNGYVTLASGYWEHGLSQSRDSSLEVGIDYQHPSGFFVGARAVTVEFALEFSYDQSRDVESSAYAGYHRRRGDWSWTVGLGRYAYPGTAVDYDYTTIDAGFGYRDRVFYSVSSSHEYYGLPRSSLAQEVDVAFPLRANFELGLGVGRFEISGRPVRINHWNVGLSKLLGPVALDLRYYDSDYERLSYLGDPTARHWVLSVSYLLRRKQR